MSKERSRTWLMVLYPKENESHKIIIDNIQKSTLFGLEWGYIDHEGEKDDDDNQKKDHTHVIIRFENALRKSSVVKVLDIDSDNEHFVVLCHSMKAYLRYMIHLGYPDKIQYKADQFKGSDDMKKNLSKAMKKDVDESDKAVLLLSWLDKQGYVSLTELTHYCANNDLWDVFRRSQTIMLNLLKEHNGTISIRERKKYYEENSCRNTSNKMDV